MGDVGRRAMNRLPYLSQRLFNTPLCIHPAKVEVIIAALAERLGVTSLTRISGETIRPSPMAFYDEDDDGEFYREGEVPDAGYDLINGVAVIPITGTLVQKLGGVRPWSGMSGYNGIRNAFRCALEDPGAKAIVLDIDSPGGEVAGCFDLVDTIYQGRGPKPIHAVLNEVAYSAAYAIASAADRVIVPRTGGVGSIGVMAVHVDFSKALDNAGMKVTFIQCGANKTDGAPEKPLSDTALARFQGDIDFLGDIFFDLVARNRKLTRQAVKDTEAATYLGKDGVALGLADAVMPPQDAFRELQDSLA